MALIFVDAIKKDKIIINYIMGEKMNKKDSKRTFAFYALISG